jgi:hypothetical protein
MAALIAFARNDGKQQCHCEEAMADVAICAITVLGLLLKEAVSSSGGIGVETKITAYREQIEAET